MFSKVLIANRGEIAVRVMRTCRALGLGTVAVYSQADRAALHARLADEAVEIGPAAASESYLNIPRLLEAARASGAEAIHPGYGFLAENAEFAEAVTEAGLCWIGPPPQAMRQMGGKLTAREVAQAAGAPLVPGSGALPDAQAAAQAAAKIGYPVLLKAAAGGGGKGMRVVERAEDIASAFERARSEAQRSFGNPQVYLEKYVRHAKHIEIQVFSDAHGNHLWLGERECSIQRRHQKLIEETPSVALNDAARRQMGQAAAALARGCDYRGAGTVEFLFDADAEAFYFLEMNTRLQVEHPVTELVTGLDLVAWQLEVAAGKKLPLAQKHIKSQGAAIECRIYAEGSIDFLPETGRLRVFRPPQGEGLRLDAGVEQGDPVSAFYDSLLAKFIAFGADRAQAIARMADGLDRFAIAGVVTNLAYHRAVMDDPDFQSGAHLTDFVQTHPMDLTPSERDVAAMASALAALVQRRRQHLVEALAEGVDGWPDAGGLL